MLVLAAEADYETVRAIHHVAYRDMVIRQYGAWQDDVQDEFFRKTWLRQPHHLVCVDGEVRGYCCIHEDDRSIRIREFAVLPDHQRQGIGSGVLERLIERATLARKEMKLNVMKTNESARRLYEHAGFIVLGENVTHLFMSRPY